MNEVIVVLLLLGLMFLPLWCAIFCLVAARIIEGGWGSGDSQG
jgi:hypothetical protein